MFVVTGQDVAAVSSYGNNWDVASISWVGSGPAHSLNAVVWADLGYYFAAGNDGEIQRSNNGRAWTGLTPYGEVGSSFQGTYRAAAYGNELVVLASGLGSYLDGDNWSSSVAGSWDNARWVSETMSGYGVVQLVPDSSWSVGFRPTHVRINFEWQDPPGPHSYVYGVRLYDVSSNLICNGVTVEQNEWIEITGWAGQDLGTFRAFDNMENFYLTELEFKGVSAIGPAEIHVSSSYGESWVQVESFEWHGSSWFNGATYGNDTFVVVGEADAGPVILTSQDGANWYRRTPDSGEATLFNDVHYGGAQFAVVGDNGEVQTSTDGTSWSIASSVGDFILQGISYGSGRWVTVGNSGAIYASADCTSWEQRPAAGGFAGNFRAVFWDGLRFVAVGDAGQIQTSSNGLTWTARTSGVTDTLYAAAGYYMPYSYAAGDVAPVVGQGFFIGGSDYSERVIRWPRIHRTAREIKSVDCTVELDNADGALNHFHYLKYMIPQSVVLQMDVNSETLRMFTGAIKDIGYGYGTCKVKCKDNLWQFSERRVGDSDAPVVFTNQYPSVIAWTLCTCYGGMSTTTDSSNPDIYYPFYSDWHQQFTADNVRVSARYNGQKIFEALDRLAEMTDTSIWADGYSRVNFLRNSMTQSADVVLDFNHWMDLQLDVEGLKMINQQAIGFNYSVSSNYWQSTVNYEDNSSVNTFGIHGNLLRDESIWFVDSISALTVATQRVIRRAQPPDRYTVDTTLIGLDRTIAETVRLVEPFFNVNSSQRWRIMDQTINLEDGTVEYEVDMEIGYDPFYLDDSTLDGEDRLL